MKNLQLARGLMVALALLAAGGLAASGVVQAQAVPEGMKKYMPDTDGFKAFTEDKGADMEAQAKKDIEALKKRQQEHADEYTKMLAKTLTEPKAENKETGKGMDKYMPTAAGFKQQTNTNLTKLSIGDLMTEGEGCMKYNWQPVKGLQEVCCYNFKKCPKKSNGDYQDYCRPTKCWGNKKGSAFDIEYWEPSAVIEVSCRSDYSMLKPGGVGTRGEKTMQNCVGANKPGNGRWFFEARVWAINGNDGQLRHQSALGGTNGERMRQCSEFDDPGDTEAKRYWGYGRNKEGTFTHPTSNGSGPGGSWEAYISDKDPTWAMDNGGVNATKAGVCKPNSTDIANCWGTMNPSGWVNHMNPRLAAVTVAWRAHTKALGMKKVSGPGNGGYQLMMDFPFVRHAGAAGSEMKAGSGGKSGSGCFKPGASGPAWYGGYVPDAIPDKVQALTSPTLTSVAEVNSGVYVFTVWVQTKCRRWTVETKGPAGMCKYEDKS